MAQISIDALLSDPAFGAVLLAVILLAFECLAEGACVSSAREAAFGSAEFQARPEVVALRAKHASAVAPHEGEAAGVPATSSSLDGIAWNTDGYPDMGDGIYGRLLPYEHWHRLARAQRAHHNALESIATVVTLTIVAGLTLPVPAAVVGFVTFFARIAYGCMYRKHGPEGRKIPVLVTTLCTFAQFGMSVYTCIRFMGA